MQKFTKYLGNNSKKAVTKTYTGIKNSISNRKYSSISALAYKQINKTKTKPPLPVINTSSWSPESAVSSILYETPILNNNVENNQDKSHVFNCLVQNEPGVLSRVSGILAGRGFNIDSLVVCNTEVHDLSRMTIVLKGQDGVIEQARRQLEDLVPVWAVLNYTNIPIIQRELLLARVSLLGPEYFEELLAHHRNLANQQTSSQKSTTASPTNTNTNTNVDKNTDHHTDSFHLGKMAPSQALRLKHEHLQYITQLSAQFGGKIVDISENSCVVELSAKPDRVSALVALLEPFGILEAARSGMMAIARSNISSANKSINNEQKPDDSIDVSALPPS